VNPAVAARSTRVSRRSNRNRRRAAVSTLKREKGNRAARVNAKNRFSETVWVQWTLIARLPLKSSRQIDIQADVL